MEEFIKEGDIVCFQLSEQQEIFGEYKGIVWDTESPASKYYKIIRVASVVVHGVQTQGGIIPQQTLVKVGNNFMDEVLISTKNIITIKKLVVNSKLYKLYLQVVTGLAIPNDGMPGSPSFGLTS